MEDEDTHLTFYFSWTINICMCEFSLILNSNNNIIISKTLHIIEFTTGIIDSDDVLVKLQNIVCRIWIHKPISKCFCCWHFCVVEVCQECVSYTRIRIWHLFYNIISHLQYLPNFWDTLIKYTLQFTIQWQNTTYSQLQ